MLLNATGVPAAKAPRTVIEGITSRCDVPYSADGVKGHTVDIVSSDEVFGPAPVVVYFHYGTMAKPTRRTGLELCGCIAKRGFTVINAEVRPLKEGRDLTDVLADLNALLLWIGSSAEERRFDLEHVYASGTFRGTLAAVWASMICNGEHLRGVMASETYPGFRIGGLGLFSPIYCRRDTDLVLRGTLKHMFRTRPELEEYVFPETNIGRERFPPTLLATCTRGPERRSASVYRQALDADGVRNDFLEFGTRGLGAGFMEKNPAAPEAVRTVSRMAAVFRDRRRRNSLSPRDLLRLPLPSNFSLMRRS